MPFIGRDWRSPGEAWVKTESLGWQCLKTAPHCRVSVKTREVAMYNTISEAFYGLDFYNAIHDIRRFNYVCKLLHLLITQSLTSLSGCATKVLFTMLERVAWEVSSNKRNIHVIRNLLNELNETIQKYYCWGRPIGSSLLWQQHFDTIDRISRIVNEIELSQTSKNTNEITFDKLPIEMIREILLRLNDYRDLVNSAQASPVMRNMIDEQYIWQKLCHYHFTDQQLKFILENSNYLNLVKRNTLRGIKYARTTTADGKVSYRNPVARRQVNSRRSLNSERHDSDYQQQNGLQGGRSSDSDSSSSESTSHVIKAIKIFDQDGASTTLAITNGRRSSSSSSSRDTKSRLGTSKTNGNLQTKSCPEAADKENTNRLNSDINWELVFHQLRKKFDLKEEYADCLLLCRQCRCLFWKSIGHPCIKGNDDGAQTRQAEKEVTCTNRLAGAEQQSDSSNSSSRPSVASLSRTFDGRARNANTENRQSSGLRQSAQSDGRPAGQRRGSNSARPPLVNRNVLEQNRHVHGQPDVDREARQLHSRKLNCEELVPKHITITPQAFLKFFSL